MCKIVPRLGAATSRAVTGTLILIFSLAAGSAHAALISYADDRAGFLAATGATAIELPASGSGNGVTVGDVTFHNGTPLGSIAFNNYSNEIPGSDLGISGQENFSLTIAIAGDAYSIGFYIHEPTYFGTNSGSTGTWGCNATCVDTMFAITLLAGSNELGSFSYNAPNDSSVNPGGPLGFFGVSSDTPFTTVMVRDVTNTIDNEIFGGFLLGSAPLTSVPEPSTLALWSVGFAGLLLGRRRRGRNAG